MVQKLNFCSLLASLVLFCVPWVDIRCSGKSQATQSGLQVVFGGASQVDDHGEARPKSLETKEDGERRTLGFAPFTALALVCLLGACFFSIRRLARGTAGKLDLLSASLSSLALLFLLLQWKYGFPAETRVPELLTSSPTGHRARPQENASLLQSFLNPVSTLSTMAAGNIEVKTLPAFFYLLGTLTIPAITFVISLLAKVKRSR